MASRHQTEWIIAKLTSAEKGVTNDRLLSRVKRLLLYDRALPVHWNAAKTPVRKRYAFFGEAGPGTGQSVSYSDHDCFILYLAYLTSKLGWKPSLIVPAFRVFRQELCREYDRLTSPDCKIRFCKFVASKNDLKFYK